MAAKVLIIYESKYGNTKSVAEAIAEGMREVPGVEAVLNEVKEVKLDKITEFDAIVVGSPNHIGSATKGIRKFIDEVGKLSPGVKLGAVFDTYIGGDFEKAVKKMEKQIGEKVPGLKLAAPGLSIKVEGMKGPISEGELPRGKEFGAKVASQLKA
jgi:flavorubredoxin